MLLVEVPAAEKDPVVKSALNINVPVIPLPQVVVPVTVNAVLIVVVRPAVFILSDATVLPLPLIVPVAC